MIENSNDYFGKKDTIECSNQTKTNIKDRNIYKLAFKKNSAYLFQHESKLCIIHYSVKALDYSGLASNNFCNVDSMVFGYSDFP